MVVMVVPNHDTPDLGVEWYNKSWKSIGAHHGAPRVLCLSEGEKGNHKRQVTEDTQLSTSQAGS